MFKLNIVRRALNLGYDLQKILQSPIFIIRFVVKTKDYEKEDIVEIIGEEFHIMYSTVFNGIDGIGNFNYCRAIADSGWLCIQRDC